MSLHAVSSKRVVSWFALIGFFALLVTVSGQRSLASAVKARPPAKALAQPMPFLEAVAPSLTVSDTLTHTLYLPAISAHQATVITVTFSSRIVTVGAEDFGAAFDGAGAMAGPVDMLMIAGVEPWEFDIYYEMTRTYLEAVIPESLTSTRVLTAELVLNACARLGPGDLPPMMAVFNPGTWDGPLPYSPEVLWPSVDLETAVAAIWTPDLPSFDQCSDESSYGTTMIPIDPTLVVPGQRLKLVCRDAEDHVDLRITYSSGRRTFFAPAASPPSYWLRIVVDEYVLPWR